MVIDRTQELIEDERAANLIRSICRQLEAACRSAVDRGLKVDIETDGVQEFGKQYSYPILHITVAKPI